MNWMISDSLESKLGEAECPSVFLAGIIGQLVSVSTGPNGMKVIMVTEDITGGLNLIYNIPSQAIIRYGTQEYTVEFGPKKFLSVDRTGTKLRVTIGEIYEQ